MRRTKEEQELHRQHLLRKMKMEVVLSRVQSGNPHVVSDPGSRAAIGHDIAPSSSEHKHIEKIFCENKTPRDKHEGILRGLYHNNMLLQMIDLKICEQG